MLVTILYVIIYYFLPLDMNFLINFCQSLNIPFFTEDSDLNIKKCGLRKPEYIKKLSILKELVGNHYVNIMLSFFFLILYFILF